MPLTPALAKLKKARFVTASHILIYIHINTDLFLLGSEDASLHLFLLSRHHSIAYHVSAALRTLLAPYCAMTPITPI